MDKFPWNKRYALGISEVDDQHLTLIYILNNLGDYVEKGHVESVRTVMVPMLTSYMGNHFAFEQKAMLEAGYDHLVGHIAAHQDFSDRAKTIIHGTADPLRMAKDLHLLVFRWFIEHLVAEDGRFGRWLAEHPDHKRDVFPAGTRILRTSAVRRTTQVVRRGQL